MGTLSVQAQQFYRFKGEVSIKDKLADGSFRLTMGKVYYDKIYKKIVYQLKFPKLETLVIQDTSMYTINEKNLIINSQRTVLIPDFTIFHLALTGKLGDYGLKPKPDEKPVYKITKVEKTDKGITSTWTPIDARMKKVFGDIKMLNVNKQLDAMIFYNGKGRIVSQQYFKKYVVIKGISFPTEVTMIAFNEKNEKTIQLSTYKNIKIDDENENEIYRYKLPITRSAAAKK